MHKIMSDFDGISRLREEQEKTLKNCESMIEKWEKFKEDYKAVEKLLDELPRKTTHDVMVPIGSLAFMPGHLIHTNEIMVLLGDNWFAERSATQAVEIAKRRLKSVEEYLSNLHKEHENILSHVAFTTDVANIQNQSDFQEIKEELTEKDRERQAKINWKEMRSRRVAHAKATEHSVKKVDVRSNSGNRQTKSKEDENLFARLDELERQEKINNELENEEYFADIAACRTITNESASVQNETRETLPAASKTPLSSSNFNVPGGKESTRSLDTVNSLLSENCSFVNEHENTCVTNPCTTQNDRLRVGDTRRVVEAKDTNDTKLIKKKVKWKENVIEDESGDRVAYPKEENATIYFTHSTQPVKLQERREQGITSPADIPNEFAKQQTSSQRSQSKDKQSTTTELPVLKQDSLIHQKLVQACGDVVEHTNTETTCASNEKDKEQTKETRKISKFKAKRMKNK